MPGRKGDIVMKKVGIYFLSGAGIISIILLAMGYRPVIISDVVPDWEGINTVATIVLGIMTLLITIQISGIEHRSQTKQTKLTAFELRYNIYESIDKLSIFAQMILEGDLLERDQAETMIEFFDRTNGSHDMAIERLYKARLLFPNELAARIALVASASAMLFIDLKEFYSKVENREQTRECIKNHCSRIIEASKSIDNDIETMISLEDV